MRLLDILVPVNFYTFSNTLQNTKMYFSVIPSPDISQNRAIIYNDLSNSVIKPYEITIEEGFYAGSELALELENRINQLQNLPLYSNKIGIMNEEMRTNSQLHDCIVAAKDVIFFTNTGFLDYTGSFIDLMMYQGPIAPYRKLSSKLYKTSYEAHNVNISLQLNVPQIGAGMWAAIKDMTGLLKSKEQQVKGLTDTGWSPSPSAAAIHAMAFHIHGNVRQMQKDYKANIQKINLEDLFSFPEADLADLTEMEILENLNYIFQQ
jgi:malate synthase